jgi:hypothetical protein
MLLYFISYILLLGVSQLLARYFISYILLLGVSQLLARYIPLLSKTDLRKSLPFQLCF